MHESSFSYNVSRPYPYPWFTWVVIIGGVLATALFSVINLAADGYELINVPTSDPNVTIADSQSRWFQKWSLSNKLAATCQPQTITGGSQFYTNNTALAWTVLVVESNASLVEPNSGVVEPSLAYLNNVLEDCSFDYISYYLTQSNSTGWTINPYALVWCNISTTAGIMSLQLSANILSSEIAGLVVFETESAESLPVPGQYGLQNIWRAQYQTVFMWATYFLRTFGSIVKTNQFNATTNITAALNSVCTPSSTRTVTIACSPTGADVMSPGFFDYSTFIASGCANNIYLLGSLSTGINALTKSFYSLVLSDLGQAVPTNLLTNPGLIMELRETIPVQDLFTLLYSLTYDISPPPSDLYQNKTAFFDWFGEYFMPSDKQIATSMPVVLPAVIAAQYYCQVPQLKSTGSLLVAVLVADLVFLQVLWKVLNLAVTFSLKRQRRDANYCDGCAKRLPLPPAKEGDYELVGGTSTTATATRTAIAVGDDDDDNNNDDGKMGVSSGKMSGVGLREEELYRHRSKSTLGEHD